MIPKAGQIYEMPDGKLWIIAESVGYAVWAYTAYMQGNIEKKKTELFFIKAFKKINPAYIGDL